MSSLRQIMTPKPYAVTQHTNLHKSRMIMAEHKVRHLPVIDPETSKVIGILDQRRLLANAIKIVSQRDFQQLENIEKSMNVSSVMNEDALVLDINESISEAAKQLVSLKSGCILVVEEEKLAGIVSSVDFVKLAIED